MSITEANKRH